MKKIGILAGEASGDLLGAKLIQALRQHFPDWQFTGIGGPAMIAAGCESLFDIEKLAVMGFVEPLLRLPQLIKLRYDLLNYFQNNIPDLFIGIDSPDFNLGLERQLRRAAIPVIHYVSPSVWAWRQYRVKKIAKAVDLMLTLLPFEAKFYEQYQIPVRYVGHPLAEQIPLHIDSNAAKRALCLDENQCYVALLPGSRSQEILYMSQPFLQAAYLAWKKRPHLRFLTSHVNEQRYQEFYDCYKKYTPDLPITFFTRRSHDVLAAADVVMVTSGTVTLEAMLFKKPMIIAYRMSGFTYQMAKWLVKIPYVGLPNLLANQLLVPELIQDAVKPDMICDHVLNYLDDQEKAQELKNKFNDLHQELRVDSGIAILDAVKELLS